MLEKINEILDFWFEPEKHLSKESKKLPPLWDESNTEFDASIEQQFEILHYQATQGELNQWADQPRSCLAFIILLDQFSRRIYRGTPTAYQFDELARAVAEKGRTHKLDKELTLLQRYFFYMPYAHSEELSHQRLCLVLFKKLIEQAEQQEERVYQFFNAVYGHQVDCYDMILNFGRFPQRNEILDRESTQEELLFLGLPNNTF